MYLLGFSQGCELTYLAGIKNSESFKGFLCFDGWLNTERLDNTMINSGKDLKVFIAHGKDDKVVEPEAGEKVRDRMKESDYDIQFNSFEGGHKVDEEALISW